MKLYRIITFVSALASGSAAAQTADPNAWVPSAQAVADVDAAAMKLDLPKEFGSLNDYVRYYWGTIDGGRRVIAGVLVTAKINQMERKTLSAPVNIVAEDAAPTFADGGCMLVHIEYDVEKNSLTKSVCNSDGPRPPPPPSESR